MNLVVAHEVSAEGGSVVQSEGGGEREAPVASSHVLGCVLGTTLGCSGGQQAFMRRLHRTAAVVEGDNNVPFAGVTTLHNSKAELDVQAGRLRRR